MCDAKSWQTGGKNNIDVGRSVSLLQLLYGVGLVNHHVLYSNYKMNTNENWISECIWTETEATLLLLLNIHC